MRRKKILSAITAAVCSLAMVGGIMMSKGTNETMAAESDVVIELESSVTGGYAGDEFTLEVNMTKNNNMAGLTLWLGYDPDVLTVVSAEASDKAIYQDVMVNPNGSRDGNIFVGYSYSSFKGNTTTGNLFTVKFKIADDAAIGKTTLNYVRAEGTLDSLDKAVLVANPIDIEVKCKHGSTQASVTKNPTCTEKGTKTTTCTICNEVVKTEDVEATGHSYGDFATTKEPTCTEKGTKTATCTVCNDTKTEDIEATGHSYGDFVTTKEPTCTEKGTKTATCIVCNDTKTEDVEATGHTHGDYTVTKEPTCTEKGTKTATCTVCNDTVTEDIDALGHTLGEYTITKEATCTEKGSKEAVCTVCDEKVVEEIAALGHNFGKDEVVKEATTDKEGLVKRVCTVCGEEETEVIPKLEDKKEEVKDEDSKKDDNKNNASETPKTGDNATEALFVVLLATLSLVAVAATKKKFVENK